MKYLLFILFFSITAELKAQAPQKMSYQAVIREANNNLLSLSNISMRISILRGEFESSAVYIESQNGKTNINGLVSLQIGTGTILYGNFSKIDWSKGPYFIFTETDPDGGFDYRLNGKSELLSVPFALFAANSSSSFDTTSLHNRIIDLQFQAAENKKNIDINLDSIKANAAQSEINILGIKENADQSKINIIGIKSNAYQIALNLDSIKTNSIKIKNNIDTINTKIDVLDLIAILSSYQKVGKILNAITVEGNDSSDIKSNGNLNSSKNISLSGNIESLGDSSSIGTLEKPFKDLYISSHSLSFASDILGQNIPSTVVSNINGNLQISSGGLKLMGENASFIAPRIEGRLIGNANTASKLDTARKINGILFDGSKDINIITTNSNLTGVVTSIGSVTSIASGTITNSMLANVAVNNLSGTNTGDQILPTLLSLGAVAKNLSITGASKTKITYDVKGLVTEGSDATTADISSSTNKNYVTDIQAGVLSNTSGTNTGDESTASIKSKLGITNLSGSNTGDETTTTIKSKLGITNLSGSNTGDQTLPTLETLERSEIKDAPYFSETGILSKLTLSSNNSRDQTEEIDLTKSIQKLSGIGGRNYVLNDGVEGQVIYILPFGDETTISTINITIINGTIWNLEKNLLVTSTSDKPIIWTPFSDKRPSVTMGMAIFTENKWFITGGTSTQ